MVRLNIHLFRTLQLHKAYQVKNLKISSKISRVDHKETINELSLLQYSEEDDKWTVVETFELG